jgi:transcriptional regulator with XRE-family HTH domain
VTLTPKEVGARIRRAREEKRPKRWSRLALAKAADVSPSSIYRWETGRLPSATELVRIAEVLGIPPDELTAAPERRVELAELRELLVSLDSRVARIEVALGIDTTGSRTTD